MEVTAVEGKVGGNAAKIAANEAGITALKNNKQDKLDPLDIAKWNTVTNKMDSTTANETFATKESLGLVDAKAKENSKNVQLAQNSIASLQINKQDNLSLDQLTNIENVTKKADKTYVDQTFATDSEVTLLKATPSSRPIDRNTPYLHGQRADAGSRIFQ